MVNVPSVPEVASRRSSSTSTVAPAMGSPDSELMRRPDSVSPACAAAVVEYDNAAASTTHAQKNMRCMNASEKNHGPEPATLTT
jgi:hypothetical protein